MNTGRLFVYLYYILVNMFVYDVINTLLVIILLFNTALLLPILRNVKNNIQTFVYAVNILTILLWIVTMIGYRSETLYFDTWLRTLYATAIFIGVTYMHFTFFYPVYFNAARYYMYVVNGLAFITAYLVTLTNTVIVRGVKTPYGEPEIIFGPLFPLYITVIIIPFIVGFIRHAYLVLSKNTKVLYLLVGYFISANTAFVTNLMLPYMGVFILNWVGQFFTIVMVSFTTYSILKFNLMNIRFFTINVGVAFLLIITLSQVLFADSIKDLLVSSFVFVVAAGTGLYLVVLSQRERAALDKTISLNIEIKKINKELEDANKRLRSLDILKSEFISLVSHQLRAPLTVIKGYAATISDGMVGKITEKQKEVAIHIYDSAQSLASLVEDFLNVTKIEQGGMQYDLKKCNVNELVLSFLGDMKIQADHKKLKYKVFVSTKNLYHVMADAIKLRQVFINLVDNSIKYTPSGFVEVRLSEGVKKGTVTFSVTDSGIGISKETKKKLFTKFGRGEGAKLVSGGSGLGLYLAKQIIKAHKGSIEAVSPGTDKGSTFSVTLPYTKE